MIAGEALRIGVTAVALAIGWGVIAGLVLGSAALVMRWMGVILRF